MTGRGIFVTGTDTGVGKTLVSCVLLRALAIRRSRVIGMKPVAAGARECDGTLINEDVTMLKTCSTIDAPDALVNPYCFAEPIAPHIAAANAGVTIDIEHICRAYAALAARADHVVVEGAGGFRVPLGPRIEMTDIAARLELPVVLVVGMRLGCLNHALLTAAAIAQAGLQLAGWVANQIDPEMSHAAENVSALERRLTAPLLVSVPYMQSIDFAALANRIDTAVLESASGAALS